MSEHLYRLLERHQRLDDRLRGLQRARWADPFEIARLKKLKLALKDCIARKFRQHGIGSWHRMTGAR